MKFRFHDIKLSFGDTVGSFDPLDLFRPIIRIGPLPRIGSGFTMMERAESIVPVVRQTPMYGARGIFTFFPERPDLNHIVLPPGVDKTEERIVLAHELGHAENSINEPERWTTLVPELSRWRVDGRRPNIKVILDEEKRANARGRFHISELHPELLPRYDDEMEKALETIQHQLERLW